MLHNQSRHREDGKNNTKPDSKLFQFTVTCYRISWGSSVLMSLSKTTRQCFASLIAERPLVLSRVTTSETVINTQMYLKVQTHILFTGPVRHYDLLCLWRYTFPFFFCPSVFPTSTHTQSHLLRTPAILHSPCSGYHCLGICRKRTKEWKKLGMNSRTQTGFGYLRWLCSSSIIIKRSR